MRDADSSLHGLEDLPLLQNSEEVVIGFAFVFLAFHEERFVGLGVHAVVEQVLVVASDLGCKFEAAD